MIAGLLIIIIFPFIYFYTQMDNFNQKTDVIKRAIDEKKYYYCDNFGWKDITNEVNKFGI